MTFDSRAGAEAAKESLQVRRRSSVTVYNALINKFVNNKWFWISPTNVLYCLTSVDRAFWVLIYLEYVEQQINVKA